MFDISFSELMVIGVVALVVIGPERLPRVARTAGLLFGRLQRYVAQVKADVNREIEMSELSKVRNEFEGAAREFQHDVESRVREAEHEVREVERDIDRQLGTETAPAHAGPAQPTAPAVPAPSSAESPVPAQLELAIDEPAPAPGAQRGAGT